MEGETNGQNAQPVILSLLSLCLKRAANITDVSADKN